MRPQRSVWRVERHAYTRNHRQPQQRQDTLFNRLTGSNQHVGNWPGVTVDRKTGHIHYQGARVDVVDLPGIYSLSPYTQEEIIAREFVLSDDLDGILNIVDATNLERNLYLTMQLIGLGLPMVVALNFIDDVEAQDIHIDCARLSERLGVPVFPISARRGLGMDALLQAVTGEMQPPTHQPSYLHGVGAAIRRGAEILEATDIRACSRPFYAAKLLEDDPQIVSHVQLTPEQRKEMDDLADALSAHEIGHDHEMMFADAVYDYIEDIVRNSVHKPDHPKLTPTDRIDRVVINKWLAVSHLHRDHGAHVLDDLRPDRRGPQGPAGDPYPRHARALAGKHAARPGRVRLGHWPDL